MSAAGVRGPAAGREPPASSAGAAPASRASIRTARSELDLTARDPGSALMGFLSGQRMVRLYRSFRRVFLDEGRGLTLREFAEAVASSLPLAAVQDLGQPGIVSEVSDLFSAIDINGDVSLVAPRRARPRCR